MSEKEIRARVRQLVKKHIGSALLGQARHKRKHSIKGGELIYPDELMGSSRHRSRSRSHSRKLKGGELIYPDEMMGSARHRSKSRSHSIGRAMSKRHSRSRSRSIGRAMTRHHLRSRSHSIGRAMLGGRKHSKRINSALGGYRKVLDKVKRTHPHLSYREQQLEASHQFKGKGMRHRSRSHSRHY